MNTLKQLRKQWEKDTKPVLVVVDTEFNDTVLVVVEQLKGFNSGTHALYRYFTIGGEWVCSVDLSKETLDQCLDYVGLHFTKAMNKIERQDTGKIYHESYMDALDIMQAQPELEPKSAFKQSGSSNGIEYGEEMEKFVQWAYNAFYQDKDKTNEMA